MSENRGEFYEHLINPGTIAFEKSEQSKALIEATNVIHEAWRAENKKAPKPQRFGILSAFRGLYPTEEMLEALGFTTIDGGRNWHHPDQQSKSYSTCLYDDGHCYTLSETVKKMVGRDYFDSADLAAVGCGWRGDLHEHVRNALYGDATAEHGRQMWEGLTHIGSVRILQREPRIILERVTAACGTFKLQNGHEFLSDHKPPEYIVDRVLQRGQTGTVTAQPGTGKTLVAMLLATCVSSGSDFCGRKVEKGKVLYLSGENPDDVRARMFGLQTVYRDELNLDNILVIPQVINIPAAREALAAGLKDHGHEISLIIVDTFAAYYGGDDENSNTQAKQFTQELRKLTELPGRPAVLILAHPTKSASSASELLPRGGSAIWAEIDFNFTLRNVNGVLRLGHNKLRGIPFEDCQMILTYTGHEKLVDKNGNPFATVVASPLTKEQATVVKTTEIGCKDAILIYLSENDYAFRTDIVEAIVEGYDIAGLGKVSFKKTTVYDTMTKLQKEKLVKSVRGDRQLKLTNTGMEWLKAWQNRNSGAPEFGG
ncbi:AAA family ATPase [Pukyongiella litopenaei]|uniref:AAA family ATPase n=1 Tax=Pukyongiella litopenaei TaxID=2605946 RepID=A0A2S0MN61_9RHOB|nr:AAA family ATPase [Pukyongiella litopenaei]AVO37314.1 AAA family ATPase [Pukyongiella litopenaei]